MFGSAIDVHKPTVCLHIHYDDMFEGVVYFGDVFGSVFSFGNVLGSMFVIGDVYAYKQIAKFKALIFSEVLGIGFYFCDVF